MQPPDVTVLMTVYNGMPHLPLAVESILSQSLQEFRFVVVDDGSSDGTGRYLDSLVDARIRVLRQENQGTAAAANHGLSVCDTPFVARMDSDDIALPARLRTQLDFMRRHPEVGIVGSQIVPLGPRRVGQNLDLPTDHDAIFAALMHGRHGMAHSSIMIRREILEGLGGYWSLPLIDDWDMMLRMGEVSRLANLDTVLSQYRVHHGSLNGTSMLRMHRAISLAVERARCRQAGRDETSWSDFQNRLERRDRWTKWRERVHVYAMTQYRLAVAEMLGSRPLLGAARVGWSALCSPTRAVERIGRILSGWRRGAAS